MDVKSASCIMRLIVIVIDNIDIGNMKLKVIMC